MDAVSIRIARLEDAPALLAIYAPYVEHTAITFEYEAPSLEEFAARMARVLRRYPYLAAEREGRVVGYAYAAPFKERSAYDWSVETSIYVAEDAQRSGAGGALYRALERALSAQNILNVNACIAVPAVEGDPYLTENSARFHAHWGYQLVGRFHRCGYKFGRWYDMIWMEKFLGEHLERPPEVIPFPELEERAKGLFSERDF